mmetsp:Transcript_2240/g.6779  ORF Transcript_2240/g.6779 Transcript_2240/m.6779 type:complete len:228 (-) Transcript_2240:313-996(-)
MHGQNSRYVRLQGGEVRAVKLGTEGRGGGRVGKLQEHRPVARVIGAQETHLEEQGPVVPHKSHQLSSHEILWHAKHAYRLGRARSRVARGRVHVEGPERAHFHLHRRVAREAREARKGAIGSVRCIRLTICALCALCTAVIRMPHEVVDRVAARRGGLCGRDGRFARAGRLQVGQAPRAAHARRDGRRRAGEKGRTASQERLCLQACRSRPRAAPGAQMRHAHRARG